MTKDFTKYVTTRQAADMLGVDSSHIRNLLLGDKIKGVKMGHDWLVFAPSLEKYLATKSRAGRPTSKTPQLQTDAGAEADAKQASTKPGKGK